MDRLIYEPSLDHGLVDTALKSRLPLNGQEALDSSLQISANSPRCIGIDYGSNEIVVFPRTIGNIFHGSVQDRESLQPAMRRALRDSGLTDRYGNILGG